MSNPFLSSMRGRPRCKHRQSHSTVGVIIDANEPAETTSWMVAAEATGEMRDVDAVPQALPPPDPFPSVVGLLGFVWAPTARFFCIMSIRNFRYDGHWPTILAFFTRQWPRIGADVICSPTARSRHRTNRSNRLLAADKSRMKSRATRTLTDSNARLRRALPARLQPLQESNSVCGHAILSWADGVGGATTQTQRDGK